MINLISFIIHFPVENLFSSSAAFLKKLSQMGSACTSKW
jgi:hypothetical protein